MVLIYTKDKLAVSSIFWKLFRTKKVNINKVHDKNSFQLKVKKKPKNCMNSYKNLSITNKDFIIHTNYLMKLISNKNNNIYIKQKKMNNITCNYYIEKQI